MSKLFIILFLVASFFVVIFCPSMFILPFMFTLFVLGGCLHAFAIVIYDWVMKTINGPKALDEQLPQHATGH